MSDEYDSEEDNLGFHYNPSDQEIIQEYLIPELQNKLQQDFIVTKDIYAKEPWLLNHNNDPFFNENEWYYFTNRTQVSDKKIGCGNNAKRKITGGDNNDGFDRGHWKATDKKDIIIDENTGNIIGFKQSLTFMKGGNNKNKKKQKRGASTSTFVPGSQNSWIMTEFTTLPEKEKREDKFQELVLCKINMSKVSKNKDVHHHH